MQHTQPCARDSARGGECPLCRRTSKPRVPPCGRHVMSATTAANAARTRSALCSRPSASGSGRPAR
eukprot:119418-Prymnesium_polylepis.1